MVNEKLRKIAEDIIFNLSYTSWYTCQNEEDFNKLRQTIPRIAKERWITKTQGKNKDLLEFKFTRKDLRIRRKNMTHEEQKEKIRRVMEDMPKTEEEATLIRERSIREDEMRKIAEQGDNMSDIILRGKRSYACLNDEYWNDKIRYKKGRRGPYRHR